MTGDCLCLNLGIECLCARPGRPVRAPHGTLAAARRHYRREGPGWACRPCRQAEARREQDRARRKREQRPAELARAGPGAGRRIREMRHQAGMTQARLAAALGVAQNTLSSWEAGQYRPAAGVLGRVAAATRLERAEVPRAA